MYSIPIAVPDSIVVIASDEVALPDRTAREPLVDGRSSTPSEQTWSIIAGE